MVGRCNSYDYLLACLFSYPDTRVLVIFLMLIHYYVVVCQYFFVFTLTLHYDCSFRLYFLFLDWTVDYDSRSCFLFVLFIDLAFIQRQQCVKCFFAISNRNTNRYTSIKLFFILRVERKISFYTRGSLSTPHVERF